MAPGSNQKTALRNLPAVHVLSDAVRAQAGLEQADATALNQASRKALDSARDQILAGGSPPEMPALISWVTRALSSQPEPFKKVINATGVMLHTNLGRAPIAEAAWHAIEQARGYCDLEYDIEEGQRSSRQRHVSRILASISGAEAGLAVNNCAAALLLMVSELAGDQPTCISRGQVVEIGGGFRLPSIMEASGSRLMEIGTTNRTHLEDYEEAIAQGAGMILFVHRSNFSISGFTTEPDPKEVLALGRAHDIPVVFDLGSGCMVDTQAFGLPSETTVQQAIKQYFDAVCFSGDKLLGGPQTGLIVGRTPTIERLAKSPLARAIRCDKLQLAGLLATLELYERGQAQTHIPLLKMANLPIETLQERAIAWQEKLGGEVIDSPDTMGGGTLPGGEMPGVALALESDKPDALLKALRSQTPPIVGHIVRERILLHPRTVEPNDDPSLIAGVEQALGLAHGPGTV